MQQNTIFASRLNLQATPAIYIFSKESYFITEINYLTEEITDYGKFKSLIEKQSDLIEDVTSKITQTKQGSTIEKLAAIDNLYESTDIIYRTFLLDLIEEYIKLDKNNETGLLSKYLLAKADIESTNFFMAGNIADAVKAYADVAEDLRLEPKDRQNAYYLASYVLANSGSKDYYTIFNYLEKAVDAYPEGPNVPAIKTVIEQINIYLKSELTKEPEQELQNQNETEETENN